MKKKVIALITAIPLLLMFSIFSVANVASLAVSIPVSDVVITLDGVDVSDEIYYWDLAKSDTGTLQAGAYVLPLKAARQDIGFYVEEIEGKNSEGITVNRETGEIRAEKPGSALIVARSADGGREKSFNLVVWSSKATELNICGAFDGEGNLLTDIYQNDAFTMKAEYEPIAGVEDTTIIWSSSDNSILSVNAYSGISRAKTSGTVTIQASMNGLNGSRTVP